MAVAEPLPFGLDDLAAGRVTVVAQRRAALAMFGLGGLAAAAALPLLVRRFDLPLPLDPRHDRTVMAIYEIVAALAALRYVVAAWRSEPALVLSSEGLDHVGLLPGSRSRRFTLDQLRLYGEDGAIRIVHSDDGDDIYVERYEVRWSDGRVESHPPPLRGRRSRPTPR